jgi:hypothetical protein
MLRHCLILTLALPVLGLSAASADSMDPLPDFDALEPNFLMYDNDGKLLSGMLDVYPLAGDPVDCAVVDRVGAGIAAGYETWAYEFGLEAVSGMEIDIILITDRNEYDNPAKTKLLGKLLVNRDGEAAPQTRFERNPDDTVCPD